LGTLGNSIRGVLGDLLANPRECLST